MKRDAHMLSLASRSITTDNEQGGEVDEEKLLMRKDIAVALAWMEADRSRLFDKDYNKIRLRGMSPLCLYLRCLKP